MARLQSGFRRFGRRAPPQRVLGLHLGPHGLHAALLEGDRAQAHTCVAHVTLPADEPGEPGAPPALTDHAVQDWLQHTALASGVPPHALAVVLESEAFVRDTWVDDDDEPAHDADRCDALRMRHPALGEQPRWIVDDDGLTWALPQARWQEAQALAAHLGATLELIGHADVARALAHAYALPDPQTLPHSHALPHSHTEPDAAAVGAALGAWQGLQPQWWPEGAHRRRRRWLDFVRHIARASALGAGVCLLCLGAWHLADAAGLGGASQTPTLAELEQELSTLQQAHAQWQHRAQRAHDTQLRLDAATQQRRWRERVWDATRHAPGVWLVSVSQHGRDWQWQGEADTPAAAQDWLHTLAQSASWRQAPRLVRGQWQSARDAGAWVWAFRIQAEADQP